KLLRKLIKRLPFDIDIAAIAAIVVEVRIGDAGSGGDEIRPGGELRGEFLVEQDVGDFVGLFRNIVGGLSEFVGEALALLVNKERARFEYGRGWRKCRGYEAHDEGPQEPLRQMIERPRHDVRQHSPRRQLE